MEKPLLFRSPRRCTLDSHSRYSKLLFIWNTSYYSECLSKGLYFLSEQPVLITLLRVSFVSPWKPLPKGKRGGCGEGKTQLALSSSHDEKVDTGVITTSQVSPTFIVMPIIASNISLTIVIYKGLASVERFTNSPKWKFHYKTNMLMEIVLLQRHKNNAQKWPTNAFTVKLKD